MSVFNSVQVMTLISHVIADIESHSPTHHCDTPKYKWNATTAVL